MNIVKHSLNILKRLNHHETPVKHCKTLEATMTAAICGVLGAAFPLIAVLLKHRRCVIELLILVIWVVFPDLSVLSFQSPDSSVELLLPFGKEVIGYL